MAGLLGSVFRRKRISDLLRSRVDSLDRGETTLVTSSMIPVVPRLWILYVIGDRR